MDFYDVMYDEGFTDPEEYMDFKMNEYMNEQGEYDAHSNNKSWQDDDDDDFFDDGE